jgi:hypothetical protein
VADPTISPDLLPRAAVGLDPAGFDALVRESSRAITRLAVELGQLERETASLEALREKAELVVVARMRQAAEQSVGSVLQSRIERAESLAQAFRELSARLAGLDAVALDEIAAPTGTGAPVAPGDVTLVFQPVTGIDEATALQRRIESMRGIVDARVSHFSDGVCMVRARVTGDEPVVLEGAELGGPGWLPAQPVTDGLDSRIFMSQKRSEGHALD